VRENPAKKLQWQIPKASVLWIGCPAKLISIRNNRNWNRNWFRNYPKQDVCFGCFGSISKQGVSVFRLNRNKKKTTETSVENESSRLKGHNQTHSFGLKRATNSPSSGLCTAMLRGGGGGCWLCSCRDLLNKNVCYN
jgi:hypothetical protein